MHIKLTDVCTDITRIQKSCNHEKIGKAKENDLLRYKGLYENLTAFYKD
jgi:hypothetical protein